MDWKAIPEPCACGFVLQLNYVYGAIVFLYLSLPKNINKLAPLVLLSASMFPHHVQEFFGEVLASVLVTIGVFLLEEHLLLAEVCLSLGVAAVPATFPALLLMVLYQSVIRRSVLRIGLAIPAAMIIELEQLIKHGTAFASYATDHGVQTIMPYSGQPGFSYPFFFGMLSLLFSFGKGLLFFIPGLFLMPWSGKLMANDKKLEFQLNSLLVFTLGLLFVYSRWWSWYGGVFWGPRFFLIACIPASLLIASTLASKQRSLSGSIIVLVVLALSGWGCVQGYLYGLSNSEQCFSNNYADEFLCWYTPEWSPLWRQFVVGFQAVSPLRSVYALWCATCFFYYALCLFRKRVGKEVSITQ